MFYIGKKSRKNRRKEAGVRTHVIVALASCLMMEISKYGFFDLGKFDGARIAAQVVSGIGFLGAGMIFVHKNSIKGLTTAAGVWATSGIGMAVAEQDYLSGYEGLFGPVTFEDGPYHVDAISGATYSSRAIRNGVNLVFDYLTVLDDMSYLTEQNQSKQINPTETEEVGNE